MYIYPTRKTVHSRKRRGLRTKLFLSFCLFVTAFIILLFILYEATPIPTLPLNKLNEVDFSSTIYDQRKNEISRIGDQSTQYITLKQMEKHNSLLIKAFVRVEDERFYEHNGIDYQGMMRATWRNLLAFGKAEGASTITMQVARNMVLQDREKSFLRKFKELKVASHIEKEFGKRKILEAYLNFISFGNQIKGVQMASKIYFGKDLLKDKLEPHEVALLAGLPKAPYGYNPYGTSKNVNKALKRRNVVLAKMAESKNTAPLISKSQKKKYQKEKLDVNRQFFYKYMRNRNYSAYQNYVRKEAKKRYGLSDSDLENNGYKIITGIQFTLQKNVYDLLNDDSFFNNLNLDDKVNAGVVIMQPRTGLILAIGGGRHFKPGNQNWALENIYSGTALRPFSIYATAIEKKKIDEFTPASTLFSLGDLVIKQQHQNLLSWYQKQKLMKSSIHSLEKMQIKIPSQLFKTNHINYPLTMENTLKVNALKMAEIYSIFPNFGYLSKAHAIIKIYDKEGNEVPPKKGEEIDRKGNPKKVFTSQTSWNTHRLLQQIIASKESPVYPFIKGNSNLAGHPGTLDSREVSWFVGYTPNLVGSVVLFNDGKESTRDEKTKLGIKNSASFFSRMMKEVSKTIPSASLSFTKPKGIVDPKPKRVPSSKDVSKHDNIQKQEEYKNWIKSKLEKR
ncbi:transglycosylase domain-containing protein [Shimazuella kribbensis]|uniref:transglycosylase domain-containing protein n=1 Tax=Shimazuella kribbensis TaxID=139808 RepID=UPI000416D69D|nr:transglycosylase domain-containing protein [Shimazuella kribbensis]